MYVVWLPVLSRISPEALASAARHSDKRFADARVLTYLDPEARLGEAYSSILGLPRDVPAWDAFLVFGANARWEERPPIPTDWMHQLDRGPAARRLDGKKLAEKVKVLLASSGPR